MSVIRTGYRLMSSRLVTSAALALLASAPAGCDRSPADPRIPGPISIIARANSIHVGDTVALAVLDERGHPVDATLVQWQIDGEEVLELFGNVIAGVGEGVGAVTAVAAGEQARLAISVSAPDSGWTTFGHICGRRRDAKVWCWERSGEGVPVGTPLDLGVSNVAAYYGGPVLIPHDCMIDSEGRAMCRGYNFMGQLGTGDREYRADFTPVATDVRFRSLSLGSTHTCGVSMEGEVWCWGSGGTGQLSTATTSSSCRRTIAVACALEPVRIVLPEETVIVATGGGVNQEGDGFTCALSTGGRVRCWGDNQVGQVAAPRGSAMVTTPRLVSEDLLFRDLTAGVRHACAIDIAYQVWCWGFGNGGLGTTLPGTPEFECASRDVTWACTFSPVAASTTERFRSISAGYDGTCAISVLGRGFCWGDNRFGQVGTGEKSPDQDDNIFKPTPIALSHALVRVFSRYTVTCGIMPVGSGVCWGGGSPVPSPVPEPPV